MFDANSFHEFINHKQPSKTIEEEIRPLLPSATSADDLFGHLTLTDMCHIDTFEEGRKLDFLWTQDLLVQRLKDGIGFASIETALPGGKDCWKLVKYHVDEHLAALVLHFLPISETMAKEAELRAEAINRAWMEAEDEDPEDCTQYEEEKEDVNILRRAYGQQLALLGEYELFAEAADGSGEYVVRDIFSEGSIKKTALEYLEISGNLKTNKYNLVAGDSTMEHTIYYT